MFFPLSQEGVASHCRDIVCPKDEAAIAQRENKLSAPPRAGASFLPSMAYCALRALYKSSAYPSHRGIAISTVKIPASKEALTQYPCRSQSRFTTYSPSPAPLPPRAAVL